MIELYLGMTKHTETYIVFVQLILRHTKSKKTVILLHS